MAAQAIETLIGLCKRRFPSKSSHGIARRHEKLADAAYVHQLTGVAPSVALHIRETEQTTASLQAGRAAGHPAGHVSWPVPDGSKLGSLYSRTRGA